MNKPIMQAVGNMKLYREEIKKNQLFWEKTVKVVILKMYKQKKSFHFLRLEYEFLILTILVILKSTMTKLLVGRGELKIQKSREIVSKI